MTKAPALQPFVHEMGNGRVHVLVMPAGEGRWALSVRDLRDLCTPRFSEDGFPRPLDAYERARSYVRQMNPDHDCIACACHFGLEIYTSPMLVGRRN